MSRTLFWYVFKDLLRIFLLASGALAGIMSFGGLLRPLTEHGLDASQVMRVLGYFMPAMQTYSLPVAALFATTMVYGKLSADNELTACRAAGIGYGVMWLPAIVLGLIVATVSLLFLCFIVPVFSLKVEQVIYSNLAQLVQNQIEQNHRIELDNGQTVFAQSARVLPSPANRPRDQVVLLNSPMIVTNDRTKQKAAAREHHGPPPEDFYTAVTATAYMTQDEETGEVRMLAVMDDGAKFPRRFDGPKNGQGPMQISVHTSSFTSDPFPSPVHENVKFMPIGVINHLLEHPDESHRIRGIVADFIREEQQQRYLQQLVDHLNGPIGEVRLDGGSEAYVLSRGAASVEIRGDKLYLGSADQEVRPSPRLREIRAGQSGPGQVGLDATAREIRIRVKPDDTAQTLSTDIDLIDTVVRTGDDATPRSSFQRSFIAPMAPEMRKIETHTARYYASGASNDPEQQGRLRRELIKLYNSAVSEKHARVSFALSCLILVMVGCALGMMFKSGNFLSAFALSVVPALLSIVLVVTGQHVCQNVPWPMPRNFNDPLNIGLGLIWSGNCAVLVIAVVLLWKLSRQ